LINKVQEEIKQINQQNLFQKAEIRKNYIERVNDTSKKIRNSFIEIYNESLNNSLSSTLLNIKEKILKLKNTLINELKHDFFQDIKDSIEKNFSNKKDNSYLNFLLNNLKNFSQSLTHRSNIITILNFRDYEFFNNNLKLIETQLQNKLILKRSDEEFVGGFKFIQENENILYDFTIENILNKNEGIIQQEFPKLVDESEIKKVEEDFEQFIQKKKLEIEEYLKKYDRI
jgi:vacuolar-type H+-ATPase subunit E/Vma4